MSIEAADIIQKRIDSGLSQEDLAYLTGLARSTIRRMENGEKLRDDNEEKFTDFLNADVSLLKTFKKNLLSKKITSGSFLVEVPFVPTKSYNDFINNNELGKDNLFFLMEKIECENFISFEINSKSIDNGSKKSLSMGDIALTKEVSKDKFEIDEEKSDLWMIIIDNTIIWRQINHYDEVSNTIKCHSLNPSPEYGDLEVNLNSVQRLFKVLTRLTNL